MIIEEEAYLAHYGTKRHSGRYPWGSGGDESTGSQRSKAFLDHVRDLHREGLTDVEIARGLGMTTTQLRAAKSIAKTEQKQANILMAQRLKDKGYSNVAIGERMGINESSVRALLAPGEKDKADILQTTADMLKEQVDSKGYIDIGSGVENHLGIARTKLDTSVAILKEKGYEVHTVQVDQLGTQNKTLVKVLCPPGTTYPDVAANKDKIQQIMGYSEDGGRTYLGIKPPVSISSKRVGIRYAEDGGTEADGVMYIRPGAKDLDLGGSRYAQVRIAVDGTHYLKGMAMYKDDLPEGTDILFNTNKSRTSNKLDALKKMKDDPDNPFGAVIDRQHGALNIVNEEGSWEKWSKSLSSQVLSKQSPTLAKTQLDMKYQQKKQEFDEIMALTNPAVKKKLLESYSDDVDSAAVHLKAAAMAGQGSHVILPVPSLKPTEVYAPNYRNGDRVALIRYPHGGTFEIPELTVNNNHGEAKKLLGKARDAVGIHPDVAGRLSGADFDGDTVLVIPNNKGSLKSSPALAGLKGFDPQHSYPSYEGMKPMTPRQKAIEMGKVSNLITDMTIKGASQTEIARAVRHSMVVIDAEKHKLNWKQSEIDNGIGQLKTKYQGRANAGSSTLISRAGSETSVRARKPRSAANGGPIDIQTGKKVYTNTDESWLDAKGNRVYKMQSSTKLAEVDDAYKLSSGTTMESVYANHSNKMKDLANKARKASVEVKTIPYSPSAKIAYSNEVASLNAKLNAALKNRPLERQAQVLANTVVSAKRQANPDMTHEEVKKLKSQALFEARNRTGAGKQLIIPTSDEWNAIQAGAISNNKLTQILNNSDLDTIKQLATPKNMTIMTPTKVARGKAMLASGYTQAEVAQALGVSVTTLKRTMMEGE